MKKEKDNSPTVFVIFGATGDLARKKLFPALYDLFRAHALPAKFGIVAFARRPFTDEAFWKIAGEFLPTTSEDESTRREFLARISYSQGLFDDADSYIRLANALALRDGEMGACSNKLFHLAVHPDMYEVILKNLSDSGLTIPCGGDKGWTPLEVSRLRRLPAAFRAGPLTGWTRVLVEKPFGRDTETAEKLDTLLGKLFKEEQIFRIDHYLAKEVIQNILAFRFSNSLFEPVWNHRHIESVHISLFEKGTLESRGDFYDAVGALRDVGQNHALQMLALIAMEEPKELSAEAIRKNRAKALTLLRPIKVSEMARKVLRGQYRGFQNEEGVSKDSQTETYFFVEASLRGSRFRGVPFYLESGKGMKESSVSIEVHFKKGSILHGHDEANILTFSIQPKEAIEIKFFVKSPGLGFDIEPRTLSFSYGEIGSSKNSANAYEKVLYDAISGDQTLFASTAEVRSSWKFITSIMKGWQKVPLLEYEKGASPAVLRQHLKKNKS